MKQEQYQQAIFVLSLLGLLVAGYLLSTNIGGVPLVCGQGHSCDIVTTSQFAYIFGIPIAGYGILFYLTMLILSLIALRNSKIVPFILGLSAFGFLFSGYLVYVQRYLIGAFCVWCLSSAVIATLLFFFSIYLFIAIRRPQ